MSEDAKDKRIAELEQRERVLVRASSLSAQGLADVHIRNEQRLSRRIAELERREKESSGFLDEIARKCLGITPHGTYVPSTMADEIGAKLDRIAELERQLADAQESENRAWNSRDELLKDRNALLDQTRLGPLRAEEWQIRATRAERQLAEARKDTARLDWLDSNPKSIVRATGYRGERDSWSYIGRDGFKLDSATIREAIDAARKER